MTSDIVVRGLGLPALDHLESAWQHAWSCYMTLLSLQHPACQLIWGVPVL